MARRVAGRVAWLVAATHGVQADLTVRVGVPRVALDDEAKIVQRVTHAPLPLGVPQLMMGFTADGQIEPARVADRDRRFGVSSAEKRTSRSDIPTPPIDPAADAWQKGRAFQLGDPTGGAHGGTPRASGPSR